MDRRKASSVVSTERNRRRFERQMLRAAMFDGCVFLGNFEARWFGWC